MKLLAILLLCFSTCTYAQVRLTINGDTLKGNVKRITEYDYQVHGMFCCNSSKPDTTKRTCIYTCDTANRLETIMIEGNPYEHKTGKSKDLLKFDDKGRLRETDHYSDLDSLYSRETWTYDAHGLKTGDRSVRYPLYASNPEEYEHLNTSTKDTDGNCSVYTYNSAGKLTEQTWATFAGEEKTIYRIALCKYHSNGKLAEKTDEAYQGSEKTTFGRTLEKYDDRGNKIEEDKYLNINRDRFVLFYIGEKAYTLKFTYKYDEHNRLIESARYAEEKPHPNAATPEHKVHSGTQIGYKVLYTFDGGNNTTTNSTHVDLYHEDDGSITLEPDTTPPTSILTDVFIYSEPDSTTTSQVPKNVEERDKQGNLIKKINGNFFLERQIEYY